MNNCDNSNDYNPQEVKNFASWIMTLSPFEFTTLGIIIGYALSLSLTIDEQNSLGNWLELVGQIILTFNAQGSANTSPSTDQFNALSNKVKELEKRLNKM